MGYVIVEDDSLALFTALKNPPRNVISGIPTAYKAYKICPSVGFKKKGNTVVVSFYDFYERADSKQKHHLNSMKNRVFENDQVSSFFTQIALMSLKSIIFNELAPNILLVNKATQKRSKTFNTQFTRISGGTVTTAFFLSSKTHSSHFLKPLSNCCVFQAVLRQQTFITVTFEGHFCRFNFPPILSILENIAGENLSHVYLDRPHTEWSTF